MLFLIILTNVVGVLVVANWNWGSTLLGIREFALIILIIIYLEACLLWVFFDRGSIFYQFLIFDFFFFDWTAMKPSISYSMGLEGSIIEHWVSMQKEKLIFFIDQNFIGLSVSFGVDGISLFFIILTAFIFPCCVLGSWEWNVFLLRKQLVFLFLVELFLFLAFSALDFLLFFIFFESVLVPMFFIIGIWGSRARRIRASFYFFFYTFVGSNLLLFCIIVLYFECGNTSFSVLTELHLDLEKQKLLWLFIYLAFAAKVPTIPFHIWLPEAHVEAPTVGSIILAGLLLKLGGYGYIRILLPVFSEATRYFSSLIITLSLISIIYGSFAGVRQVDFKRIIAYSSITHMNVCVLGIFTLSVVGIQGAIFFMIAHGIVSTALFFLVGGLYERYGNRGVTYYGGLVQVMPIFSSFYVFFSLANIGLPGSCNFVGEMMLLSGISNGNLVAFSIAATGVILSVLYSMFLCNRMVFGSLKVHTGLRWRDLKKTETAVAVILGAATIILGIYPEPILDTTFTSVSYVSEISKIKC